MTLARRCPGGGGRASPVRRSWLGVGSLVLLTACAEEPAVTPPAPPPAVAPSLVGVSHLLDRPTDVVALEGELYGLGPRVPQFVQLEPEPGSTGDAVVYRLPMPPESPELKVTRGGEACEQVDRVEDMAARDDAFLFLARTQRYRAPELERRGGRTTRDAVHEVASLLLTEGDGFARKLEGLGTPVRLVLRVAGQPSVRSRLRLHLDGEEIAVVDLVDGDWKEPQFELPSDHGLLEVSVERGDASPVSPGLYRARVQWVELHRQGGDRVVFRQDAGPATVGFMPRSPRSREALTLEPGRDVLVFALGGSVQLLAPEASGEVQWGPQTISLEQGRPVDVEADAGLIAVRASIAMRVDVLQPGAPLLGYIEDPETVLHDHRLEPAVEMVDRTFRRLASNSERRMGLLLPTPSRVEIESCRLQAGDRLRWSVALADAPSDSERPPRGEVEVTVHWKPEGGDPIPLSRLPISVEAPGFFDTELLVPVAGTGSLIFATRSVEGTVGIPAFIADPRLVRAAPAESRPNLLLYLIDTLRASDLSCYGRELPTTPSLDAFARRCYRFEQFRAVASWTRPTVASMMTSLYPTHHGILDDGAALPAEVVTLAEILRNAGYSNGASVSNVQVSAHGVHFEQGFHRFLPPEAIGITDPKFQLVPSSRKVAGFLPDWFQRREQEPFFLYLHSMDPHLPYLPPAEYRGRFSTDYEGPITDRQLAFLNDLWALSEAGRLGEADFEYMRQVYDEEIRCQDDELGRLFTDLEARGRLDDTVIAVFSDHGEEFSEHGKFTHAGRMWEELLHVPLLLYVPPSLRARHGLLDPCPIGAPISQVDLMPTLLDLLGVPSPARQGHSRMSVLRGDESEPGPVYSVETLDLGSLYDGRWKLMWEPQRMKYLHPGNGAELAAGAVVAGTGTERVDRLYDLQSDPGEQWDLAGERAEVLARLQALRIEVESQHDRSGGERLSASANYGADVVALLRAMGYLPEEDPSSARGPEQPGAVQGVQARYFRSSPEQGWLELGDCRLHWRRVLEGDRRKPALAGLGPERLHWLEDPREPGINLSVPDPQNAFDRLHPRLRELMELKRCVEQHWLRTRGLPRCGLARAFDIGSWELVEDE